MVCNFQGKSNKRDVQSSGVLTILAYEKKENTKNSEKHLHIQVQPAVMYVKFVKKIMKKIQEKLLRRSIVMLTHSSSAFSPAGAFARSR